MKKYICTWVLLHLLSSFCFGQHQINGKVISSTDKLALPGASVKVQNSQVSTTSDAEGRFTLTLDAGTYQLAISYLGYKTQTTELKIDAEQQLEILLVPHDQMLNEVVVSTGYQDLPKERATGSFVKIDSALLNRRVGANILERLQDVAPGLIFNRSRGAQAGDISIRGQSTISAETMPLIVLDNFPYDGNILNINPNDVESITLLKDAAAASIWGARAGNGVIVIKTKSGTFNSRPTISINSNLTTGQHPDPFYESAISVSDFIDMEVALFKTGFYQTAEASVVKAPLTPVVELLVANRDSKLTDDQLSMALSTLKTYDLRKDINRYLYQNTLNQQYSMNLSGGSEKQRYYISGGYDRINTYLKGNGSSRLTLSASNTYKLLKDRLELTAGLYFNTQKSTQNNPGLNALQMSPILNYSYPYARLVDDAGNLLPLVHEYRSSFVSNIENNGLLNWEYYPLKELAIANNTAKTYESRVNFAVGYMLMQGLRLNFRYQYSRTPGSARNLQSIESFTTRNLINRFTQVKPDGTFFYPVPIGAILDSRNSMITSEDGRIQFNYSRDFGNKHSVHVIGGTDIRELLTATHSFREYGYDDEHAIARQVDPVNPYPLYVNTVSTALIANPSERRELTDRYRSYFVNGTYTFLGKYIGSFSSRLDQSNIFGVDANKKGVPLWSAGLAWNLSKESFYAVEQLPEIKLRLTYGFNGNVSKTLSAYTTARYLSGNTLLTKQPYADIINPPNPNLRWERISVLNTGLDFAVKNRRISGSVEYYIKRGKDLIGSSPLPATTGTTVFRGNTANTSGKGVDLNLQTININTPLNWSSDFVFSYTADKVTGYDVTNTGSNYIATGDLGNVPLVGKPLYSIYGYPWAGLDSQTGNPQGYLDGVPSSDYAKIATAATAENITFHGSARPVYYGAFRNTIRYKGIELSANLSYRLRYFFRMNTLRYSTILNGQGGHAEFATRWKVPGDELNTQVPSLPVTIDNFRDDLYAYADIHVKRGDHIRIEDVTCAYSLPANLLKRSGIGNLQVYFYGYSGALLWQKTKGSFDPDFLNQLPLKSISIGLRASL